MPNNVQQLSVYLDVADSVVLDLRSLSTFDGTQAHETEEFTGTRFSLIFYLSASSRSSFAGAEPSITARREITPSSLRSQRLALAAPKRASSAELKR